MNILTMLGGRKFLYAILVVSLAFTLVLTGKLTSDAFISFVEVIGGIYITGNVADAVAQSLGTKTE